METKSYRIIQTDLAKEITHGILVSNLARMVGERLGLDQETCYRLSVAGLLHDIGKLEMTKYICAGESLRVEEIRYVRTHAALGYAVLGQKGYEPEIAEWVLYHHENYDGSGYPSNRAGEEIPMGARILRICDVFAALVSDRSYRKAFDRQTAVELMIAEVKNFDMKMFLAFLDVVNSEKIRELVGEQSDWNEEIEKAVQQWRGRMKKEETEGKRA